MNIGIDGHMLGDHSGGNESYYTNILRAVQVDSADKVYLFVKEGVDVREFEEKFIIVRFSSRSPFRRNFMELNQLCKKYKIDVLHAQYFIPFIRSCKMVCTIYDICFEHFTDIFTTYEYVRQKLLIPYAAKKSEIVITISNYSKNDIVKHYQVTPEKIVLAYSATDKSFCKIDDKTLDIQALRKQFQIGDCQYLLSVGNLQPRKNLSRLIEAFNRWKKETHGCEKLVIVGKKAWMYSDILKEANTEPDNIVLTGYVSNEDLVRLYNGAKAFIYPSFFEGFGLPPLEAMACGTPVAVANTSSLPEVVGDAGIYFDPFNVDEIQLAIGRLMGDANLRDELIKKGFEQNKIFQWEESAKKIMKAYHACFEKTYRKAEE